MFSSDRSKQKKRRSVETNVSHSSAEEPVYQEGYRSKPGRSHSNLLNVPLHSPGSVQNASVSHETTETPDYQNTSYTDKLSIAIQMVPDLLVGDVKETLEKLLHDPAFTAELVAVGAVFVGLQATPAGPFIDAAMVATLGVDVALKLGGFLYKSYTAHNDDDLKEAAEDLKGFVEVAGLAGATKLLGMAGRTLKNLSGKATEAASTAGKATEAGKTGKVANEMGKGPRIASGVAEDPFEFTINKRGGELSLRQQTLRERLSETGRTEVGKREVTATDLAALTKREGVEHAVVILEDGKRVLVDMGSYKGGTLPADTKKLLMHSHPDDLGSGTAKFISKEDVDALRALDQRYSYMVTVDGTVRKFTQATSPFTEGNVVRKLGYDGWVNPTNP